MLLDKKAEDLIIHVAERLDNGSAPYIDEVADSGLDNHPQLAFHFLQLLPNYYEPFPELGFSSSNYQAALALFHDSLMKLRQEMEKNRAWAEEIINHLQHRVANEILVPEMGHHLQHDVLNALKEAGVDILPEVKQANQRMLAYYNRFWQKQPMPDPAKILAEMEKEGLSNVFDIAAVILAQLRLIPATQDQINVLERLADSGESRLREVVGIMLLHPDTPVRQQVPDLLIRCVQNQTLSPKTFRRMIVMRNWWPVRERPLLDQAIRTARLAGLSCAPSETGKVTSLYVSGIDGSGAQAIWTLIRTQDGWLMAHFLGCLEQGIREAWCTRAEERIDLASVLERTDGDLALMPVKPEFLNHALGHYMADGHAQSKVPPMELLRVAEATGGNGWDSQRIDPDLFAADESNLSAQRMSTILQSSDVWSLEEGFAYSWFEDDGEIDAIISQHPDLPGDMVQVVEEVSDLIIEEILEPRRQRWYYCFLLMALALYQSKPRRRASWKKFFALAKALAQDTPMEDIPLMGMIAARTIYAAVLRTEKQEG